MVRERGNRRLRTVDRYVGIPAVLLLGALPRRRPRLPESPASIGFLMTTSIGDTVLYSAALRAVRHRYPAAALVGFCSSGNEEITRLLGELDEVVPIPVSSPIEAVRRIRGRPTEVWVDFGSWPRINAVFTWFAPSTYRIGFRARGQHRHRVYDAVADHSPRGHEVENYLALVGLLGATARERPALSVDPAPACPDAVVVHVFPGGSRHYLKAWPEASWLALFGLLIERGYSIHLTGGPDDREKLEVLARKSPHASRIRVVAERFTLEETARLIRSAAAVITVDTGVLHLASALGANLVALHGPTSPARWGALNTNAVSLESGFSCSPCVSFGFEKGCGVNRCMQSIGPERVIEALDRLLERPGKVGGSR